MAQILSEALVRWDDLFNIIIARTRSHVSTEEEFHIGELPLSVHISIDAHVFDGECLVFDWCLEPLHAAPSHVPEFICKDPQHCPFTE